MKMNVTNIHQGHGLAAVVDATAEREDICLGHALMRNMLLTNLTASAHFDAADEHDECTEQAIDIIAATAIEMAAGEEPELLLIRNATADWMEGVLAAACAIASIERKANEHLAEINSVDWASVTVDDIAG